GAGKALANGLGPTGAVMLGILSGVGGGIVPDVLVTTVPSVLHRELYAGAAFIDALVVAVAHAIALPAAPAAVAGAVACFVVRWLAIRRGWRLPQPRASDPPRARGSAEHDQRAQRMVGARDAVHLREHQQRQQLAQRAHAPAAAAPQR